MKEGTYRLRADFESPEPDKRIRDWRKAPVIKAGTIVHVKSMRDAPEHFRAFVGRFAIKDVSNMPHSKWRAFFDLLDPLPDLPSRMCERRGWSHGFALGELLDSLYREGKFTLDDLSRIIEREFEGDVPEADNNAQESEQ